LKFTPLSAADHAKPHVRLVSLPARTEYIYRQHSGDFNPEEPNSAIQNAYIIDEDAALAPLAELAGLGPDKHSLIVVAETFVTLLAHIMHEAAFNQLRTIEQLGYIVHVGQGNMEHQFYLRVIVQSSVMDASGLDERIEVFFRTWYRDWVCSDDEDYSDLPADAAVAEDADVQTADGEPTDAKKGPKLLVAGVYDSYVKSLCEKLMEPEHSLSEEASKKWAQIDACRYCFDRQQKMVSVLEKLTLQDFTSYFNKFIRQTNTAAGYGDARRKFSSQFFGKNTLFPTRDSSGMCKKGDTNVVYIDNPALFKATHPLEPAVFVRK
jgi:secreted Zn-dependent insulinase-like peptidase